MIEVLNTPGKSRLNRTTRQLRATLDVVERDLAGKGLQQMVLLGKQYAAAVQRQHHQHAERALRSGQQQCPLSGVQHRQ